MRASGREVPPRTASAATCLFPDCNVVVTSWTDARIPWPRCQPAEGRSAPWLLVDEELARAIRHESALALRFYWGVSARVVWEWRRAFGIARSGTEGSRRLIRAASAKGAALTRSRELTPAQCDQRSRRAIEGGYGAFLPPGYHGPRWTPGQLALLGTAPDEEVAAQVGRTARAVRLMRTRRGIPTALDGRKRMG
jgi:hypothetical protein